MSVLLPLLASVFVLPYSGTNEPSDYSECKHFFKFCIVRLLALRPLLAYCASLG
jgi:hypothetical protein